MGWQVYTDRIKNGWTITCLAWVCTAEHMGEEYVYQRVVSRMSMGTDG